MFEFLCALRDLSVQLYTQRHSHFEHRGETWVAVFAKRFVKALAAEAGVAGDL